MDSRELCGEAINFFSERPIHAIGSSYIAILNIPVGKVGELMGGNEKPGRQQYSAIIYFCARYGERWKYNICDCSKKKRIPDNRYGMAV
jgi:hypothetical protein